MRVPMRALMGFLLALVILLAANTTPYGSAACDREHRGDLVLSGTEVFRISDMTFCQHGRIVLKDHATLVIRDAVLKIIAEGADIWAETITLRDHAELTISNVTIIISGHRPDIWAGKMSSISAHDSSTLRIADTVVETPVGRVRIDAADISTVALKELTAEDAAIYALDQGKLEMKSCHVQQLSLFHEGMADVADSVVGGAVDFMFSSNAEVHLSSLNPGT